MFKKVNGLFYLQFCGMRNLGPCLIDEFRCNLTKKCLRKPFICDGYDDCGDLSDEAHCGNITSKFVR